MGFLDYEIICVPRFTELKFSPSPLPQCFFFLLIEHYLLLFAPVYMIWSNRYVIWPFSMDVALMSFSLFALYHSFILSTMALIKGQNLNYLLMPPPGKQNTFESFRDSLLLLSALFHYEGAVLSYTLLKDVDISFGQLSGNEKSLNNKRLLTRTYPPLLH